MTGAGSGDGHDASAFGTLTKVIESLDVGPAQRAGENPKILMLTLLEALSAIYVVVHFAEHTGQVIFVTKIFSSHYLGFYKHLSQP